MSIPIIPSKDEFEIITTIAKAACDSQYFTKMGGMPGMLSIALYAREMGIPPMVALFGGMQNVMGKIQMSPEMMMSLIRGKGHKIEIVQSDDLLCQIKGTRKDTGETYIAAYSIAEAQTAGLVKQGSGWTKNPSDMLFARASGRLKRRLFPDVATKAYCEGELEEVTIEQNVPQSMPELSPSVPINVISKEQLDEIIYMLDGDAKAHETLLNFLKITDFAHTPAASFDKVRAGLVRRRDRLEHEKMSNISQENKQEE